MCTCQPARPLHHCQTSLICDRWDMTTEMKTLICLSVGQVLCNHVVDRFGTLLSCMHPPACGAIVLHACLQRLANA